MLKREANLFLAKPSCPPQRGIDSGENPVFRLKGSFEVATISKRICSKSTQPERACCSGCVSAGLRLPHKQQPGAVSKLGSFDFPARKTSFLRRECALLVLDQSKKRSLTKLEGKRTNLETEPKAGLQSHDTRAWRSWLCFQ